MGLFRRDKPLHEQLAEEAHLEIGSGDGAAEPGRRTPPARRADARVRRRLPVGSPDEFGRPSPLGEAALHGVPRPREWDTVATVAAELPGDEVHFTSLPDGTLVVEEDLRDGALNPLADAIEAAIDPPYHAEGVRRGDAVWAVGARRIQVRSFPDLEGDELEVVEDGQFVVGRRVDGELFDGQVSPV